ncbi:hypothetical protein OBBRIDRAFT_500437 [Obba rivulosa]|uniref:Uncharacterized protein n=1 Tax=Obba rivulosa TaxID=1052685 RepID=A0A8E2DU72_9APHY|nr:hypothetical protein OBBRIDRAFT_500437 [Obba rivulosa]
MEERSRGVEERVCGLVRGGARVIRGCGMPEYSGLAFGAYGQRDVCPAGQGGIDRPGNRQDVKHELFPNARSEMKICDPVQYCTRYIDAYSSAGCKARRCTVSLTNPVPTIMLLSGTKRPALQEVCDIVRRRVRGCASHQPCIAPFKIVRASARLIRPADQRPDPRAADQTDGEPAGSSQFVEKSEYRRGTDENSRATVMLIRLCTLCWMFPLGHAVSGDEAYDLILS